MKTRESKPRRAFKQNVYKLIFLIGWPIFVQLLMNWIRRRNRQKAINI